MDWPIGSAAALGSILMVAASSAAPKPAAPIVAGTALGPEITPLEERVGAEPADAEALERLARTYLAHDAPGLAHAALSRAPAPVRDSPRVAHLRGVALAHLGRVDAALDLQSSVLERCSRVPCTSELVARARRSAQWLDRMNRMGVDDSRVEPERAYVAYRLSTRQVGLAVH